MSTTLGETPQKKNQKKNCNKRTKKKEPKLEKLQYQKKNQKKKNYNVAIELFALEPGDPPSRTTLT
jgi:hypothetical protein